MKNNNKWTNEELINKLFQHDETALRCLYEAHAYELLNYFTACYKTLSRDEISDIITDSLIKLTDNPKKFKPEISSLKTYLVRDITGDILNALSKIKRAKKKLPVVALSDNHGNIKEESKEETSRLKPQVQNFLQKILGSEQDVQLAWMMEIDKERDTAKYASILQITHLPTTEQRSEVKKHKDRIQKKLNRSGWKDFLQKLKQNV